MTDPSTLSTALFTLIVLVVAALFAVAVRTVAPAVGAERSRSALVILGVLIGWLGIPGALAAGRLLDRYTPLPAPALIMVAVVTIATVALAFSPLGARVAAGVPLAALVGYQVFRVPVELLLHRLNTEGVIPIQMTYAGRNWDIISGITAAALALGLRSGLRAPRLVFAWNLLGLGLLVNIVAVAVLSTPVPFRQFMNEPANLLPSRFPYVWLPTFLVQAALFGHLLVFRALRSTKT